MTSGSTIFALSSGSGRAGIAVIRVSGPGAQLAITALAGNLPPPRLAVVRDIRHPVLGAGAASTGEESATSKARLIDRGLVLWFAGPASVTGEDMAEFHVHGGAAVVEAVLRALGSLPGFVPAEAGAFTRRAFENDKLDLVEAEGLADLLSAETEHQRRVAMRQFSGEASSIYETWRAHLVAVLAMIEASIDFADEDGVAAAAIEQVRPKIESLKRELEVALVHSERAAAVRRGLQIVIGGAPNVGKSSLLNALVGRDAAIVSDIAGTTRDVVEAGLVIEGMVVVIADTAGLRDDGSDAIEGEGMRRARLRMDDADILLWVSSPDVNPTVVPGREPDICVLNKSDLTGLESILARNDSVVMQKQPQIPVSTRNGQGLVALREELSRLVRERTTVSDDAVMVRERHRLAIVESIRFLNDALTCEGEALELVAEDVRKAALALARITGRVETEEFLGHIFREFCIGK